MKRFFILLILAIFLTSYSHAEEKKRYMNLFDDNGYVKLFHVGNVLCDRENNIWNKKCQDALLEDIYGHVWPEVKKVILAFQKAVAKNDYRYLRGKTVIPDKDLTITISSRTDTGFAYRLDDDTERHYLVEEEQIGRAFLQKIPDDVRAEIGSIKYEDIKFDWWSAGMPMFSDKCKIRFNVLHDEISHSGSFIFYYVPRIESMYLE